MLIYLCMFIYIYVNTCISIYIFVYFHIHFVTIVLQVDGFKVLISPYLHSLRSRTATSSRAAWCVPSFAPHLAAFTWNLGISDANIFHWQGQLDERVVRRMIFKYVGINYVQVSHLSSHFGYISSWLLGEALQCLFFFGSLKPRTWLKRTGDASMSLKAIQCLGRTWRAHPNAGSAGSLLEFMVSWWTQVHLGTAQLLMFRLLTWIFQKVYVIKPNPRTKMFIYNFIYVFIYIYHDHISIT